MCYSCSTVSGGTYLGGIVGYDCSTSTTSYSYYDSSVCSVGKTVGDGTGTECVGFSNSNMLLYCKGRLNTYAAVYNEKNSPKACGWEQSSSESYPTLNFDTTP
ncbi:MAG: hypothetical protein R3Y04_03500 [Rikenellaceae bacterium]